MNVLHVSTPLSWRGGEQQAAYLALSLKEMNIAEAVLCPQGSALSERLKESGIPLRYFQKRGGLDLRVAREIKNSCKDGNFDLIHTHDSHGHSAAVISAAFFGNTVPIVVSRRVDFAVSGNPFSSWKYNHPSVKKIICVSEMIRKITEPAIQDVSKLCVVHSGIDSTLYDFVQNENPLRKEFSLTDDTLLVGNLSALADHKDYTTFLKTAKAILTTGINAHFIIAGTGPEEENIRKMISILGLQEQVHLLGFRKDVQSVMKALDIFLITSSTEGLGTIVLEAFAAGVPVVATRAGGIPELVADGVTGLKANIGDVNGLTNAVLRIFEDHELRFQLVSNAHLKVKDFSFRATAAKTLKVYKEVLSS